MNVKPGRFWAPTESFSTLNPNPNVKPYAVPIEMRCGAKGDEELGTVGVGARIGHRKLPAVQMLIHKRFVCTNTQNPKS